MMGGAFVRVEPRSGYTGRTMGLDKYPYFHVVLVMRPASRKTTYSFDHEAATRSDHSEDTPLHSTPEIKHK